jgi:hypothetical protein
MDPTVIAKTRIAEQEGIVIDEQVRATVLQVFHQGIYSAEVVVEVWLEGSGVFHVPVSCRVHYEAIEKGEK